jgi:drug/metabolite transporter (DMT)-like permease
MKLTDRSKGATALLGAAFIYACFGLLIREMSTMFGDNAQTAFRFVVAFALLGLFALFFKRPAKISRRTFIKIASLGVAFCGVVLLFTMSVNLTTLGNSVFLLYAGSIIASLLIGTLALKEKLTIVKIVAIVLSLIGLAMYSSALLSLSLGIIAAVASGILDGVSNSIRKTLGGVDRNTVLLYQYAIGSACALLVLAIAPQDAIQTVSAWPVLVGVVFAVLIILLGNLLLYGFQHFDVNIGTVILATELFFASLIGWLFFREVPATNEVIGGVIIFIASILSAVDIQALMKRQRATS